MRLPKLLGLMLLLLGLGLQLGCERKMKLAVRTVIVDAGQSAPKDAGPSHSP